MPGKMSLWSDGVERPASYQGTDLYQALRAYYQTRNDELYLQLLWDNEYLRKLIAEEMLIRLRKVA
jgi:hypothetical protein